MTKSKQHFSTRAAKKGYKANNNSNNKQQSPKTKDKQSKHINSKCYALPLSVSPFYKDSSPQLHLSVIVAGVAAAAAVDEDGADKLADSKVDRQQSTLPFAFCFLLLSPYCDSSSSSSVASSPTPEVHIKRF